MIQKEIALQQVRTGRFRDLPDAGEQGQIIFAEDVGRVAIGSPSKSNPSSLVAGRNWDNSPETCKENIELITEFTPWDIVNRVVVTPYKITIPANSTKNITFKGTTRLIIEYVAYDTDVKSTRLESGTIQVVQIGKRSLLSQFNNTNMDDGIVKVELDSFEYREETRSMFLKYKNNNTQSMIIEFIIRGWDDVDY